jgi:hypothetical protein
MNQHLPGGDARANSSEAVVFSLLNGFVWASWPGASGSVRLGRYEGVVDMMRDFLAQSELGDRLARANRDVKRQQRAAG